MVLCNNKPYTYDAAGNKLKKVSQENNATVPFNNVNYTSNITTTTTYIAGAVYESKAYSNPSLVSLEYTDVLQFIAHEEGRIRPVRDVNMTFRPFSFEMKWNIWEYHNQNQAPCKNLF